MQHATRQRARYVRIVGYAACTDRNSHTRMRVAYEEFRSASLAGQLFVLATGAEKHQRDFSAVLVPLFGGGGGGGARRL